MPGFWVEAKWCFSLTSMFSPLSFFFPSPFSKIFICSKQWGRWKITCKGTRNRINIRLYQEHWIPKKNWRHAFQDPRERTWCLNCRILYLVKAGSASSSWCGSLGRALVCEAKRHWFDSRQGTCLSCEPSSQLGVGKRQTSMFLSLSPFLPLSIKINKIFFLNQWP